MYVCPRMKKDVYCGSENGWFRVARSFPAVARELCKEIAVSRNTRRLRDSGWCRRRGRALAFPVFAILALKSSDSFFSFFFSSYIYLPIYLDSFLCACAVRVILRGQRTSVRVRSFHNYISVSRAGRRIDALSTLFAHFEHKSVSSSVASHRAV